MGHISDLPSYPVNPVKWVVWISCLPYIIAMDLTQSICVFHYSENRHAKGMKHSEVANRPM